MLVPLYILYLFFMSWDTDGCLFQLKSALLALIPEPQHVARMDHQPLGMQDSADFKLIVQWNSTITIIFSMDSTYQVDPSTGICGPTAPSGAMSLVSGWVSTTTSAQVSSNVFRIIVLTFH